MKEIDDAVKLRHEDEDQDREITIDKGELLTMWQAQGEIQVEAQRV